MFDVKLAIWSIRDDIVFQVTGCQAMLCFEEKKEEFISYPLSDWSQYIFFKRGVT